MELNELNRFGPKGLKFMLYKDDYFTSKWSCTIESHQSGLRVEAVGKGETSVEAVIEAVRKFDRMVHSGAPELDAPQLEHHAEPAPRPTDDDKVPF